MKIGTIIWDSYASMLVRSSKKLDFIELTNHSINILKNDCSKAEEILFELEQQDIILLYRTNDFFWDEIEERLQEIGKNVPIICIGHDPSYWNLSTVKPNIIATCHSYIVSGGKENFCNMFKYIASEVMGIDIEVPSIQSMPWEGLYHPDAPHHFEQIKDYLEWYKPDKEFVVGLLFSRYSWVNNNLEVEDAIIRELEYNGMNVIPIFCYSVKDEKLGAKGSEEVIQEYFIKNAVPIIDALIKMQMFFISQNAGHDRDVSIANQGVELLKRLDVPVFQPVSSYYCTIEEWENDAQGLGRDISWSIAMPEFEGIIEPIIVGAIEFKEGIRQKVPIKERCAKVANRVIKWIKLKKKLAANRKIAFILHNNPCASVEATVGGGAHLDTLESVARIMNRMKNIGYSTKPPIDGKELIDTIMERKAISEFRWTTVDEIV